MYESKWASGIKWFNTMLNPMFFFIQGEVIYLFLLLIYVPSLLTLKLILSIIALLMVAKIFGYSIVQLSRRWRRLQIGKRRAIYPMEANKRRFLAGI